MSLINNITDQSDIVSEKHDINYGEASLLCSILMICIAVIGIIANIITVRIFTHRSLISGINTLIAGLALVDTALLISGVPLYSSVAIFTYLTSLTDNEKHIERLEQSIAYMTVYVYPLTSIFQTASVFTMVVITVERWIAVCFPLKARTACTRLRAICVLGTVSFVSVLYNITRFWEYEIRYNYDHQSDDDGRDLKTDDSDGRDLKIDNSDGREFKNIEVVPALRGNRHYMHIYGHWMYFVFLFAIPFTVLVLLNTLVVITIKRANRFRSNLTRRQCKEHGTAIMMVVVAMVFLGCNTLAFILNAMDALGLSTFTSSDQLNHNQSRIDESIDIEVGAPVFTPLFYLLIDLSNLLVLTHCSSHFFIYINFSKRFRNYVFTLFPFRYLSNRRLSDFKTDSLLKRDPLSTASLKHRKPSLRVSIMEDNRELETISRTRSFVYRCETMSKIKKDRQLSIPRSR